jgi:2-dehydro-3-deoxygluconokinase
MINACCIGECMVELRAAGEGMLRQGFAGDSYNTAVYLKRSAPEIAVHYVTATGTDPMSQAMRAAWFAEGIDDDLAFAVPDRRPGLYMIELDAGGERRFHYWRGESAARRWLVERRPRLSLRHFAGHPAARGTARRAVAAGGIARQGREDRLRPQLPRSAVALAR